MGIGYVYICPECQNSVRYSLGVGMALPAICRKTKKAALSGKHGDEWAEFVKEHPTGAFDCETVLYSCRCGRLIEDMRLHYYVNKDESLPLDCFFVRSNGIRCIKRYIHKCPSCDKRMKEIDIEKAPPACSSCGSEMQLSDIIRWD